MNHPPCEQAKKVMRLTQRQLSDATGLTLLLQESEVQGSQIKKNGKWVPIKLVPGAFIANVCDIIEVRQHMFVLLPCHINEYFAL